jgi:hypothetical protein
MMCNQLLLGHLENSTRQVPLAMDFQQRLRCLLGKGAIIPPDGSTKYKNKTVWFVRAGEIRFNGKNRVIQL